MADTVEIKLAAPADAAAVLALLKQLNIESAAILVPHLNDITVEQEAQSIDQINSSTDAIMLLAVYQDQPIGIVTIMNLPNRPQVGELGVAVLKDYWRNGIGSFLVDEAEYWFANYSSLNQLVLDVFEDNQAAIALYQKYGFVKTGKTKVQDQNGQLRDALLMEWQA